MDEIERFLTSEFLPRRKLSQPDGRLLFQYACSDDEFWHLVNLLDQCGPPQGYDFDRYRSLWRTVHAEPLGYRAPSAAVQDRTVAQAELTQLNWPVRAFVLYASEFWHRFLDEHWCKAHFLDGLPFKKLTWAAFLSLVGWMELYRGKIVGYVRMGDSDHFVAHNKEDFPGRSDPRPNSRRRHRPVRETSRSYPALYIPMLGAWEWWVVAPLRLPTSYRYLDTIAHQGGGGDSLAIEYEFAFSQGTKRYYRATKPPDGHGTEVFSLEADSLPAGSAWRLLAVTVASVDEKRRGSMP